MKNIKQLTRENNLTSKERIMLLIKNDIHKLKTGKDILLEADRSVISKNWKANNNQEVIEYNKLARIWKEFYKFNVDMNIWFLNTELEISNFMKILLLYYYRTDISNLKDILDNSGCGINQKALSYIVNNTGLNYKEVSEEVDNLDEIIEQEYLVVKEKNIKILNKRYSETIITGESLFNASKNIPFVKEYKDYINKIYMYGFLFKKIQELRMKGKYAQLLAYQETANKISMVIAEELFNTPEKFLRRFEDITEEINNYLQSILVYIDNQLIYKRADKIHIETFFEKFKINLNNVKPKAQKPIIFFMKEAQEILRSEWK